MDVIFSHIQFLIEFFVSRFEQKSIVSSAKLVLDETVDSSEPFKALMRTSRLIHRTAMSSANLWSDMELVHYVY